MTFYIGDIAGLFWGNQLPHDATHLGILPSYTYSFNGCGCDCLVNPTDSTNELYCTRHYTSYVNHVERVSTNDNKTYFQNNILHYSFTADHIPMLQANMHAIQANMHAIQPTCLKSFEIIDKIVTTKPYHEVWYKYVLNHNTDNMNNVLVARLCLAKQIMYCLEKYQTCTFEVHYEFE